MESQIDAQTKDKDELMNEESDESIDDEQTLTEIEDLNKKIETSPYNYQLHVDRIKLLRKCGEYEQLLLARKKMAELFPLTQDLWLSWLEDEQKFADTEEEHEHVEALFQRAVKDYMCPEIWLEYAQYSIRYIGKENGFEKIRSVLQQAITASGLHVRKGASIWEAYREIENAILVSIQPAPGSMTTPQQNELINNQTSRISSLFTRQLAIPLLDMEETYEEYLEWKKSLGEEAEIPQHVKESYKKSLATLEEIKVFEADLEEESMSKIEIYEKYIEYEKKSNDPARVQCIYERALAENCLNSQLWIAYLSYLHKTLKSGPTVISACSRAVRNCPWISSLWQTYLLALERNQTSYEKLEATYKEALDVGFSSAGDYAFLFQAWCDIVRRYYCNGTDKDELGRLLRAAFENSTSYMLNNVFNAFKSTGDPDYTLWCYWAHCEVEYLKNITKARQIIDVLLEDDPDARRNWKIWREYYEIERLHGDFDHCRAVLRRAVQSCAADDGAAEMACAHFVRFERENGTLESLDDAQKKVDARLAKVQKRKDKAAVQNQERKKKFEQNGTTNKKWKRNEKKQTEERTSKKRSAKQEFSKSEIPEKKRKQNSDADTQFKIPTSLPPKVSSHSAKDTKPNVTSVPPPGFAAIKQSVQKPQESVLKKSHLQTNLKEQILPESDTMQNVNERSPESDARTVFLSNLGFEVESIEDKLKHIFSECGTVSSIRLVKSKKGSFRGYAYIEFENKSSVKEALKLDRKPLEGRPIFVSPNIDKTKYPDFKVFKYSKGMEKQKLFVSGLCFDTTEETLCKEFSKHGQLKSVRIVTARNGKSKGLAYVEYETEADAAQSLIKTDQSVIDGFTIKVAISNPPARNHLQEDRSKSLGGGGRSQTIGGRGKGRTQVSFLPRSVQKSSSAVRSAESKEENIGKPMSNKDFAKMLLKN